MRLAALIFNFSLCCLGGAAIYGVLRYLDTGDSSYDLTLIGLLKSWAIGAIISLPLALPLIIATERMGRGPWWLFLICGMATGIALGVILGLTNGVIGFSEILRSTVMTVPSTVFAAMGYWLNAWHYNPPAADHSASTKVFE